jgi:hypothetical protein
MTEMGFKMAIKAADDVGSDVEGAATWHPTWRAVGLTWKRTCRLRLQIPIFLGRGRSFISRQTKLNLIAIALLPLPPIVTYLDFPLLHR